MIRINKPQQPPVILTTKGRIKRRTCCAAYTRHKQDYKTGVKKFEFDSGIYGHESVKSALIEAQHDKCCFCESKVSHIAYGDVEHFRPKGGYCQDAGDEIEKPGYYWLAYEWTNLFFCCQLCNQRFKKNLFPLIDPNKRARSHKDNPNQEEPVFVSPAEDNPEDFISFRAEIPFAINDNMRGKATISALGLDRNVLNEVRGDYLEHLRMIYSIANANPPYPETKEAKALLKKAIQDSSLYAGMARAAIASEFQIA